MLKRYLALGFAFTMMVGSMVACQNANQITDETTTTETEVVETEVTETAMTNANGGLVDGNGETVGTQVVVDESGNQVVVDKSGNKIEKDATGNYVVKKKVTQTQTVAQNKNNTKNNATQKVAQNNNQNKVVATQATKAQTKATQAQTKAPATQAQTKAPTTQATTSTPATQHVHNYTKSISEPVYKTVKTRNPKYYQYSADGSERTWMADGSESDAYITSKVVDYVNYYKKCSCGATKLVGSY